MTDTIDSIGQRPATEISTDDTGVVLEILPNPVATILDLEHQIFDLRMTIADMAVDLYTCRQQLG